MTTTLSQLIDSHGVGVLDHLDRSVDVPVLARLQFQGDVAVIPRCQRSAEGAEVPPGGVAVVAGENGGHTHLLLGEGAVRWDVSGTLPDLGRLNVPAGATAWLAHPEHGYTGIGPGSYVLRRQIEQAELIRVVAD